LNTTRRATAAAIRVEPRIIRVIDVLAQDRG
jgi:hypothetical protein